MTVQAVVLVVSIVAAGLSAGLLFGWLVSVIPGTARIDDRSFVHTMQEINLAIINPAFLIPFVLTPVALIGAAVLLYRSGNTPQATGLVVAATIYVLGVLGVTIGGNIPLNNALAELNIDELSMEGLAAERTKFEQRWNRWHATRTAASVAAFVVALSVSTTNVGG